VTVGVIVYVGVTVLVGVFVLVIVGVTEAVALGVGVLVNVGLNAAPKPMLITLLSSCANPAADALAMFATGAGPAPGYTTLIIML
jgi:hypothetical protein